MITKTFLAIVSAMVFMMPTQSVAGSAQLPEPDFMQKIDEFPAMEAAKGLTTIVDKLAFRIHEAPFLLVASVIFLLAILHTFFAIPITKIAHRVQKEHERSIQSLRTRNGDEPSAEDLVSFKATVLHFLGEVEAIFGIWVLVLIGAMAAFHGMPAVKGYLMNVNYTEPLFVVVIMALASTRPVFAFAEGCLSFFARIGRQTPSAWWLSIMIVAPLLGSFITEPGAMTIAAMLLAKKFYKLKPSPKFSYATLGLLFVNVSIGGVLTNFAAPPVLMVAGKWGLTTAEMFLHFGDKALVSITSSSLIYFLLFRKELAVMARNAADSDTSESGKTTRIPLFVTLTHLGFMAWTVTFAHHPPLFVGGFLFFLAFQQATANHQHAINLRGPILVGFFLGGLVIHGGLQGWWLSPVISSLTQMPLFIGSVFLTSFNDNAAITFLASQVPDLSAQLKYAVLAGAVTGGGLTVIANAPNPAGQALLARFFGDGVSPVKLALAALLPTILAALCMIYFPDNGIEAMFAPVRATIVPNHP